jgi:hypothetical protein
MTVHVQTAHTRVFVQRKLQFSEKVVELAIHVRKSRNKRKSSFAYVITTFFSATNPYKKIDEQQQFLEDLVLYICKGYMPLSTCENIWL